MAHERIKVLKRGVLKSQVKRALFRIFLKFILFERAHFFMFQEPWNINSNSGLLVVVFWSVTSGFHFVVNSVLSHDCRL